MDKNKVISLSLYDSASHICANDFIPIATQLRFHFPTVIEDQHCSLHLSLFLQPKQQYCNKGKLQFILSGRSCCSTSTFLHSVMERNFLCILFSSANLKNGAATRFYLLPRIFICKVHYATSFCTHGCIGLSEGSLKSGTAEVSVILHHISHSLINFERSFNHLKSSGVPRAFYGG